MLKIFAQIMANFSALRMRAHPCIPMSYAYAYWYQISPWIQNLTRHELTPNYTMLRILSISVL